MSLPWPLAPRYYVMSEVKSIEPMVDGCFAVCSHSIPMPDFKPKTQGAVLINLHACGYCVEPLTEETTRIHFCKPSCVPRILTKSKTHSITIAGFGFSDPNFPRAVIDRVAKYVCSGRLLHLANHYSPSNNAKYVKGSTDLEMEASINKMVKSVRSVGRVIKNVEFSSNAKGRAWKRRFTAATLPSQKLSQSLSKLSSNSSGPSTRRRARTKIAEPSTIMRSPKMSSTSVRRYSRSHSISGESHSIGLEMKAASIALSQRAARTIVAAGTRRATLFVAPTNVQAKAQSVIPKTRTSIAADAKMEANFQEEQEDMIRRLRAPTKMGQFSVSFADVDRENHFLESNAQGSADRTRVSFPRIIIILFCGW